ncbi:group I truncated hemoglobin [Polycyclovorans algicola]|uniref:group I truncated hemoglobin n=1 Tax=Polycyclovorans algicola TaxID=616992 RepID=UPI0004A76409|nr:group 1 truncated hemoglobin [Polycyclovorans algicola]
MNIKSAFKVTATTAALAFAVAGTQPAFAQDGPAFDASGKAKAFPGIPSGTVEAMGGEAGINLWVKQLFHYILLDYRIAPIFIEHGNIERQIALNTQLVQRVLGNGEEYMGASMTAAHGDLGITMEEFNAVVEAAYNACDAVSYHYYQCNQIIAGLAPFTFDIVTQ